MNARKFFKVEVSSSWGYLVKEKKPLTKQEETIKEARVAYCEGIRKAWDIYTQDNVAVKEAKKVLDSEIDEAYRLCLPNNGEGLEQKEYEKAKRLYLKTLSKVHGEFADKVGMIWDVFMKYIETSLSLTKKNI